MVVRLLGSLLAGAALCAQPVQVYSEFQRVDPFGAILSVDRAEAPREILSPALARNAWASFLVVLTPSGTEPYYVFISQNPDNAVRTEVYQVGWEKHGAGWIPDALAPLKLSSSGQVPEIPRSVTGQKVIALWLDLWVAADAPVRRTRLEVQFNGGGHWVVYPMELRIRPPVVPKPDAAQPALAPPEQPSSAVAAAVLRAAACGSRTDAAADGPVSIRRAIRRNARQDVALAHALHVPYAQLLKGAGIDSLPAFCEAEAAPPRAAGAEWYLKVRDALLRWQD